MGAQFWSVYVPVTAAQPYNMTIEQIEIVQGLTLPVAQVGHLMVMKVLSRDDRFRPADADDLVGLSLVATDTDWDRALTAARLVEQRGYNRDRDIVVAIEALRDRPGMY